jgi:hypothetical protein
MTDANGRALVLIFCARSVIVATFLNRESILILFASFLVFFFFCMESWLSSFNEWSNYMSFRAAKKCTEATPL